MNKPTVAVYKFSSCDGCQLSIFNLEDELLDLAGAVEIAYFLEATQPCAARTVRHRHRRRLGHHPARSRAHQRDSQASARS